MKKTAVTALAALTAAAFAAPMTMEEANAPMPAKVNGYLPDAAPESQGVPSAAIADWLGTLDREVRHVHAFTILKNGYRIAEGAWAPYASVDRHSLYGLSGLFFADLIGRNLVCAKIESLPDAKVVEALRVKVAAHPNRETEAFWRLASNGDRVLDRNLLWMNRNFTTFLGFSWEGGCSAGDGLGRRTAVRHLALMGELHLRGGTWYGEKLFNANFAAQYYRFTTRPSGLKVAYGERGQLLMVSPKEHLVVAMTADTDQSERMVAITEENLLEDGERKTETRKCGEGTCDLKKVIASLRLETCDETAVPDGAVPFNATFDLAGNRYGFKTLRLEKTGAKTYVLELGGKETQILRFASAPNLLDVTFANGSKALTALNGKYRVSMTGGFTAPKKFRAVLYAVDTAAKFEWAIDFADTSRPVFTIVRHGEVKPEIVAGKPAETICGVKRDQTRAEILWTHPIHKRRYIGWPTVCRRKNGEVLASFSGNREGHVCPYGRSELVRSSDNGETWSTRSTIIHNDIVDDRDTAILKLANGDLVARWFGSTCYAGNYDQLFCKQPRDLVDAARGEWTKRSADGGRTWKDLAPMVGHAPHGPIQLRDGRLLQFGVAATRHDVWNARNYPERRDGFVVEESTDNAKSWHRIAFVPFGKKEVYQEPHLIECRDGRLLVMIRTQILGGTWMTESRDGGRTWDKVRETPFRIGGHPPHLSHTSSGKILLTHCKRAQHLNVVYVSDDDGHTWDQKNEIRLSKGFSDDMGYTTTTELADGTFLSVYYGPENRGEPPCLMATKWRLKDVEDKER